ncbi:translation elongation factor Ts [Hahella sp. CCB-MM4]|uniref:translation elongation factor Ts n=1 Tax=Hahella sp. (strain CCB-MM4) TaxID=1926491 RepID=UPI000B9B59AB|nr:translation elongation factor Ts [Hahella sp. CCB-MM4]OZG70484.1 translation elongation factor Ts [Hahella sp. CCB-MM4]
MAAISASMVKELRERTGLGMMECKKALVEADGNIETAIENLRKSSGMKAAKKAGRISADGVVAVMVDDSNKQGLVVEVNSETDFVARDDNFLAFVNAVVEKAFASKQTDVAALMAGDLEDQRSGLVQKIGENINVRRLQFVEADTVGAYVHGNKRIAVLIGLKGGSEELAKDVAMHVAAVNPQYISRDDVSEDVITKEREIYSVQAEQSGKPAEIVAKMVDGRISKFLSEISLLEQPFVKDPDTKVGDLVKKAGAEVVSMVRYEVGDGIEKEEVDFAAEVAAQLKG